MKTRRLLQIVTLLLVTLIPAMALAHPSSPQPSAFQRAIAGSVLDPNESSLWIDPPQGGAVMVYENGDLKGWFLKPGGITVQPNHVYGVLATRGSSVVFHSGLLVRAGATKVSFRGSDDRPAVAFQPAFIGYGHGHAYGHAHPARPRPVAARPRPAGATHATPRAAAKPQPAKPQPADGSARKAVAAAPRAKLPTNKSTKSALSRRTTAVRLNRGAPLRAIARSR